MLRRKLQVVFIFFLRFNVWSTDSSSWVNNNSSTKPRKVRQRQCGAVWL